LQFQSYCHFPFESNNLSDKQLKDIIYGTVFDGFTDFASPDDYTM